MAEIVQLRPRSYQAAAFETPWEGKSFQLSGTLDGFIDLAVPGGGTYPLSLREARLLAAALSAAIDDVSANCLYDRDPLLARD